jgi:hypothetical protein
MPDREMLVLKLVQKYGVVGVNLGDKKELGALGLAQFVLLFGEVEV